MIEAVTFDFWNTLFREVDPGETLNLRIRMMGNVIEQRGYQVTSEMIQRAFIRCWEIVRREQIIEGYDRGPRGHVLLITRFLELPPEIELQDELFRAYTSVLLQIPPVLIDGAAEVLDYLAAHYRLGLICNTGATPGSVLRHFIQEHGLMKYFSVLVFSDEVVWAKPNSAIFTYALERLGDKNLKAVHIGDDPLTDVIGARRSGMKAAWFAPGASWPVPECTWHLKSLLEIKNIL